MIKIVKTREDITVRLNLSKPLTKPLLVFTPTSLVLLKYVSSYIFVRSRFSLKYGYLRTNYKLLVDIHKSRTRTSIRKIFSIRPLAHISKDSLH